MSVSYQAVGWNRQKKIYDLTLVGGIVIYLAAFVAGSLALQPEITIESALIRGFGTGALLLLHVILSIGPLCRLDRRWLPLLYNRRHLGIAMFVLALAHGGFATVQFHVLGTLNPLVNVLVGNSRYDSLGEFPFQPLGLLALAILFLMAATSHDFWLANLSPRVWKSLHMMVYIAYASIVLHVALGILQVETHPVLVAVLAIGMAWLLTIHLVAGWRERAGDKPLRGPRNTDGFLEVCAVSEIPEKRAKVVSVAGERVAVYQYDGVISALSSVCKHQNGPLGEGKIVDGCVVCPWHGFQYQPADGKAPAPFSEKVATFNVRVDRDRVFIDPRPNPPGTHVTPARIDGGDGSSAHASLEGGAHA